MKTFGYTMAFLCLAFIGTVLYQEYPASYERSCEMAGGEVINNKCIIEE